MLFKLLTAPITAPVAGFRFILDKVEEMAERELYDEERIREEFLLLQLRLDEGEISEEEYLVEEADVMARLRAAREYWRQQSGR
jgi:Gas vesicle protein G